MWGLRSLKTGKVVQIVLNEVECVVGRSYGGITILGDASISRRHAVLKLVHSEDNLENLDCPSTLTIKDTGSKYGTFVNGVQLTTDSIKTLSADDVIKFGQIDSSYRVFHKNLVVSTSCVGESELHELKRVICKLGGHTIREWHSSCTHLVMPFVRVTSKALCCLVSLKPLVTLQFFHALLTSITSKVPEKAFPREKDFIPRVSETLIDQQRASFNIVPDRQNLFKNKKFIFLERDMYEKYHLPIMIGGGTALLAERGDPPFFTASSCIEPGTCVIQPVCKNLNTEGFFFAIFEGIVEILKRNKKRFIPDNDIVLAVVYCSTETYCNPDFIESVPMLESKDKTIPSQSFSQREVCTEGSKDMDHEILCENTVSSSSDASSVHEMSPCKSIPESQTDVKQQIVSDDSSDCIYVDKESSRKVIMEINLSSDEEYPKVPDVTVISVKNGIGDKVGLKKRKNPCFTDHASSKKVKTMDCSEHPLSSESAVKDLSDKEQTNSKKSAAPGPEAITVSTNRINSTPKANESTGSKSFDENLPSNLAEVVFCDLVKRKVQPSVNEDPAPESGNSNKAVKNFKQFKKVLHVGARSLPKIIGGNDLVSHQDVVLPSDRHMNEWIEPHPEEIQDSPEERGEFDWDN